MDTSAVTSPTSHPADPWVTLGKVGRAAVVGAVGITTITLVGAGIILASPALPPILAIASIAIPPVVFITGRFLAVMFVALPILIATSVYSAAFMIPFGIAVGSALGGAALLLGIGALLMRVGDQKALDYYGGPRIDEARKSSCVYKQPFVETVENWVSPPGTKVS